MSKASCTLTAESWPPEILTRIGELLDSRGWDVERQGDGLVGYEDATRLCCVESPAMVTVSVSPTAIDIQATVPGRGPVSSRNARARLDLVARAVAEAWRSRSSVTQ
jgi:hypothetical protein